MASAFDFTNVSILEMWFGMTVFVLFGINIRPDAYYACTNNICIGLTRNRKHRRAAAKPAACAKPLMLSTSGSKGQRGGRVS